MEHLFYLCLVFVMLSCLLFAALWSPEGKGLTSWLLFVMFIVILLTFSFGILGQVWYLIVSILDPCCLSYFHTAPSPESLPESLHIYFTFLARFCDTYWFCQYSAIGFQQLYLSFIQN